MRGFVMCTCINGTRDGQDLSALGSRRRAFFPYSHRFRSFEQTSTSFRIPSYSYLPILNHNHPFPQSTTGGSGFDLDICLTQLQISSTQITSRRCIIYGPKINNSRRQGGGQELRYCFGDTSKCIPVLFLGFSRSLLHLICLPLHYQFIMHRTARLF